MIPPSPASTDRPSSSPAASATALEVRTPEVRETSTAPSESETPAVPQQLWLDELHNESLAVLLERAAALRLRINPDRTRHHLVLDLVRAYGNRGTEIFADGIIEIAPQGSGFLRWPRYNFRSLPQDVYVSSQLERRFFVRNGNRL